MNANIMAAAVFVFTLVACAAAAQEADLRIRLAGALAREDRAAVAAIVAEAREAAGARAGVPETPDAYIPIPADARWLTPEEARQGFAPLVRRIDQMKWWRIGLDPAQTPRALREPASVVSGFVDAHRAGLDGADAMLAVATEAGDFLLWAQEQAGGGPFPFPAYRGETNDNAFRAAGRFLDQAEREGRLDEVVRNGWAFEDFDDGGLQFDNGEAGVAIFELYEATGDARYRDAGVKAAEWALARPLVTNWNYNSFSVYLLAKAYEVTGDARYRDGAVTKALVGVIPGQLTGGPNAGRWLDPHNARPAYHYLMLRGLAALAKTLSPDAAGRAPIVDALDRGLRARNPDFTAKGAPNKDKAMEALLVVHEAFAADPAFLRATASDTALVALGRLVSHEARQGAVPLSPREWAQFLAVAAQRPAENRFD